MNLYEQAAALGLQTDFIDGYGHPHRTDTKALEQVLQALPAPPSRRLIATVPVVRASEPGSTALSGFATSPVKWTARAAGQVIASGAAEHGHIAWPSDLPLGVYGARIEDAAGITETAPLVAAPAACFTGAFDRVWLIAVQLYSVHSHRNWGIGDFTDLEALIRFAAGLGADGVGLNPLHALFDDRPGDCSPYSPNSRQFLNPLYIDVTRLPGVVLDPADTEELARLRSEPLVDYAGVAVLKDRALRAAYAAREPDPDFEAFRAERGDTLARFTCFEVLRHRRKTPWWVWNDVKTAQDAHAIAQAEGLSDDIDFIAYVQWIADRQLRDCRDLALQSGMTVGLYLDIAVGVQSDGFDAWDEQAAISRHLGVGAPPDAMNTAGQSWGLAGYNAAGLEARDFAPFREMLRASMRYAGAVRLDHVLGLKRLYLVPHGFPPNEGVYVQMPFEAMLAVTALESVANECVVIGEDLGTVPDGFREMLARWGVWSYRVMMFEQDYHSKAFFAPSHYPANALVTFNTHDIATYEGWRTSADLAQKRAIGLDPGETDDSRAHALHELARVLRDNGIHGQDFASVVAFLARTPSRILAVALEDLLRVVAQPNIPGTVNENPNWRRRLPRAIEEYASVIDVDALTAAVAARDARHAAAAV